MNDYIPNEIAVLLDEDVICRGRNGASISGTLTKFESDPIEIDGITYRQIRALYFDGGYTPYPLDAFDRIETDAGDF